MKLVPALVALGISTSTTASAGTELLASCALGTAHDYVVEVFAEDRAGDTLTVALRTKHDAGAPLFADEPDESRGTSVRIDCSGGDEKVLVIRGEFFGSGYPRGVILRYNGGTLQRLEFAERSLSGVLYLGAAEMRLYVADAYRPRKAGWTVYRFDATSGKDADQKIATRLPDQGSDQKIMLK